MARESFTRSRSGADWGDKKVFWLSPGTLVFNIVFAWEGAVAVVSGAENGMIGSHRFPTYAVVPGRADAAFLQCFFVAPFGRFLLDFSSPGAAGRNKTLNQERLMSEEVLLPTASEQRAISAFLDRKTAAIDALIAKKERLLELLAEKRAAVIDQAVTKGLDAGALTRLSGIPSMGLIPANWTETRLKHVTSFVTSGARDWGQYYAEAGPVFLRIGNVERDRIELDLSDLQRVALPQGGEVARTRAATGDVPHHNHRRTRLCWRRAGRSR